MPFVLAFGLAVVLTPAAARLANAITLVDAPPVSGRSRDDADLKIHIRPIPVLGGAAVVAAVIGGAWILGQGPAASVTAAVIIALGAGIADDARPLPPWVRVQFQILAGLALAAGGLRFGPEGAIGVAALVALTVACANAVNLVDGQDGLAAGLGAIAALGLGILAGGQWWTLGSATAGGLSGFLVWNRPPARIFLGNGGAYATGVILAALAAVVTQAGGGAGSARGRRVPGRVRVRACHDDRSARVGESSTDGRGSSPRIRPPRDLAPRANPLHARPLGDRRGGCRRPLLIGI